MSLCTCENDKDETCFVHGSSHKIRRRIEELRKELAAVTKELADYKKITTANEVRAGDIAGDGNKLIKCAEGHVWLKGYSPNCPFCERLAQSSAENAILRSALEFLVKHSPHDGEESVCIYCDMGGAGYSSKGDNHHDDIRDVCPVVVANKALSASPSEALAAVRGAIKTLEPWCPNSGWGVYAAVAEALAQLKKVFGDV